MFAIMELPPPRRDMGHLLLHKFLLVRRLPFCHAPPELGGTKAAVALFPQRWLSFA